MTPWIPDANDLQPSQVVSFQNNLLHPTRRVEAFLEPENREATIVVAPKGFGKTLLLMAKRFSLKTSITRILPEGQTLIDKPSGSPSVIKSSEYGEIRDEVSYWKNLWLVSIGLTITKAQVFRLENLSTSTQKIIDNEDLVSCCDIFDAILTSDRDDYYNYIDDYNDHIISKVRKIDSQVALFVDNIDEYFGDSYAADFDGKSRHFGTLKDSYWYHSQLGLALASRELNGINKHLKIFVSIRKEVLQKSVKMGSFWTQLKGKSIEIKYTEADIEAIISKNIKSEQKKNLVSPAAALSIDKFVGKNTQIVHPKTGDEEDFLSFWIRHTLNRPRDVISIGREISLLQPSERTADRLSKCVRKEAADLVRAYMYEMQPHLPGFDPDLICRLIPSNTFTKQELETVSKAYSESFRNKYTTSETHTDHVFCALFKIGILGYVASDVDGAIRQAFRPIGEDSLDEAGILPDVERYIVHPSMDNLIGELNPKYYQSLNKYNVIGNGRVWREERSISYVVKGDVKGFSKICAEENKATEFDKYIRKSLREVSQGIDYSEVSGGDSVLMVDKNPVSVISAASELAIKLENSEFNCQMRFGAHAGFISIVAENGVKRLQGGYALRTAARLEQAGIPGIVLASDQFLEAMQAQFENTIFKFIKLEPDVVAP